MIRRVGVAAMIVAGCQWDVVIGQQSAPIQLDVPVFDAPDAAVSDAAMSDAAIATDRGVPADRLTSNDLPDAATVDVITPTDRPEAPTGSITGLSLGDAFTCVTRSDRSVWCWGANDRGQLGRGGTVDSPLPARVRGLSDVVAIAAGGAHACAIRMDLGVWCWGANDHGQLGDGTTADRAEPVRAGTLEASSLSVGASHSCAHHGSSVHCWGANDRGQLGDGTTSDRAAPTAIAGAMSAVRCGRAHTCANTAAGVDCWGANDLGQLGDSTSNDRLTPVSVHGAAGCTLLAVGAAHGCARELPDRVRCWGEGARGARGDGSVAALREATRVDPWTGSIKMAAGESFTCASSGSSEFRCAGRNDRGQLGQPGAMDQLMPTQLIALTISRADFTSLAAGRAHACTALNDGTLWCWGDNRRGQVGDGFGESLASPERVWR